MLSILAIADIHLGRHPSRIPHDDHSLRVPTVWDVSIDYAINNRIDVVVLSGDIVDATDKYIEAFGAVRRGLERLGQAGITVYAVSGNHDHDVLPRLLNDISNDTLHLLGQNGTWETIPFKQGGQILAWFTGWSFPSAHYRRVPLDDYDESSKQEPVIGIIHGDLDSPGSQYAPLALGTLQSLPVDCWVLGHIHKPQLISAPSSTVLYPGSLQPLDPSESGIHGPWELKLDSSGDISAKQIPLASVLYKRLSVDVTNSENFEEIQSRITGAYSSETERLHGKYPNLHHVSFRLILEGTTSMHRTLATLSLEELSNLDDIRGHLRATVDKVHVNTTPVRNLANIARFKDPPGTIAKWMLDLSTTQERHKVFKEIATEVSKSLKTINRSKKFSPLGDKMTLDEAALEHYIMTQGHLLVDTLMAQKESD